jgi:hypothetical protein
MAGMQHHTQQKSLKTEKFHKHFESQDWLLL